MDEDRWAESEPGADDADVTLRLSFEDLKAEHGEAGVVHFEGNPSMWSIGALFGAALLGFCAGLWSFRVKSRWCPACGRATYPLADRRGG